MTFWSRVVDALVVFFALFFIFLGLGFIYFGVTGAGLPWSDAPIEGGQGSPKVVLGFVFLLAAAPMLYFVFHPSAKGMPPAKRKTDVSDAKDAVSKP